MTIPSDSNGIWKAAIQPYGKVPQAVTNPSQFHLKSFFNPVQVRRMNRSVTVLRGLISISK